MMTIILVFFLQDIIFETIDSIFLLGVGNSAWFDTLGADSL